MNVREFDILNTIYQDGFSTQRALSDKAECSLGMINKSLRVLCEEGYLTDKFTMTDRGVSEFTKNKPRNAIILAAGFGMRMVPINKDNTKGLLTVEEEPLVERLITQLWEVGVTEIYIVVGYLKEKYDYLIDKYGVKLIVNMEYANKNNLYSLYLASEHLANTYIVPCDIWASKNPFNKNELYSWYMVSDLVNDNSDVRVNRNMELVRVDGQRGGNTMVGISYLLADTAAVVKGKLTEYVTEYKHDNDFWEEALYQGGKMTVSAKVVRHHEVLEINTYEQLRNLDDKSQQLNSAVMELIEKQLKCNNEDVQDIKLVRKGMTNRTFMFTCRGQRFIMRIPGEGTELLINRRHEFEVYEILKKTAISERVIYFDRNKGYKLAELIENAHNCDAFDWDEVKLCMDYVKAFHGMKLEVKHTFDLKEKMDFYQNLWLEDSVFRDYKETRQKAAELIDIIAAMKKEWTLCHIDCVSDNFMIIKNEGKVDVKLIDWEYSAMQDAHIDIAMFAIYSMYDKAQVDKLIDLYFDGHCEHDIRIKIYCYVAVCGLIWSNWCEYKRQLGVEFGEYSLRQYRYAKEYYNYVMEELNPKQKVIK